MLDLASDLRDLPGRERVVGTGASSRAVDGNKVVVDVDDAGHRSEPDLQVAVLPVDLDRIDASDR